MVFCIMAHYKRMMFSEEMMEAITETPAKMWKHTIHVIKKKKKKKHCGKRLRKAQIKEQNQAGGQKKVEV